MKVSVIVLFQFILLCYSALYAQADSSAVKKITLTDGSELVGKIIFQDETKISFESNAGVKIDIARDKIAKIEDLHGKWKNGTYMRMDPNQTRLLFAPTARTLPAGKGYFSAYELFFPMLAFGVTDQITLAGGISVFPGLDLDEQIISLAPKVRLVQSEAFALSAGVLYMNFLDVDFGVTYGVMTFGEPDLAATIGLGYGFAEGDWADNPLIVLGGEVQVSNYVKLITENWLPPNVDGALVSLGIRFFGEKLAADFAFMTSTESESATIPWLGFAYNF